MTYSQLRFSLALNREHSTEAVLPKIFGHATTEWEARNTEKLGTQFKLRSTDKSKGNHHSNHISISVRPNPWNSIFRATKFPLSRCLQRKLTPPKSHSVQVDRLPFHLLSTTQTAIELCAPVCNRNSTALALNGSLIMFIGMPMALYSTNCTILQHYQRLNRKGCTEQKWSWTSKEGKGRKGNCTKLRSSLFATFLVDIKTDSLPSSTPPLPKSRQQRQGWLIWGHPQPFR